MSVLCVIVLFFSGATVQPQELSGEEILDRVEQTLMRVDDYTATLDIVADIEGLSVPPMNVTMYFKQPDKVHFDSEGFALIPREGLAMSLTKLKENFSVGRTDRDTVHGEPAYRLTLEPKSERTRTRRLQVLVNPDRWTVERIVTSTVNGRSIEATFVYMDVEGYWLPSALDVHFAASRSDSTDIPSWEQQPRGRGPREGKLEIRYSSYRINTGLRDELFDQQQEPEKP
jgi:outer membrane lipoprotein-sorting protein